MSQVTLVTVPSIVPFKEVLYDFVTHKDKIIITTCSLVAGCAVGVFVAMSSAILVQFVSAGALATLPIVVFGVVIPKGWIVGSISGSLIAVIVLVMGMMISVPCSVWRVANRHQPEQQRLQEQEDLVFHKKLGHVIETKMLV